jgi:hypothetical protein
LAQQDLLPQKDLVECARNAMQAVSAVCQKHGETSTKITSIIWHQFPSSPVLNIIDALSTAEVDTVIKGKTGIKCIETFMVYCNILFHYIVGLSFV